METMDVPVGGVLPDSGRSLERLGGVAGLVFAGGVVVQNAVLLAGTPLPGAPLADVRRFYDEAGGRISIAVGIVALNVVCLLFFASAVAERLGHDPSCRLAGRTGFGAAVLLAGAFLTTTAIQAVLTARVESLADGGVLEALWDLHSAAFAMSASSLAVVLVAFALGAWHSGRVVPRWTAGLGFVGAVALTCAGALVVSTVGGGGAIYAQLLGFVVWLVFLVTASLGLLRRAAWS
jgi:hypothetical protein